jgi:hypothetical protein
VRTIQNVLKLYNNVQHLRNLDQIHSRPIKHEFLLSKKKNSPLEQDKSSAPVTKNKESES